MDKDVLAKRIEAVKVKIEKINKRIEKHTKAQTEEAFIKYLAPWYQKDPKTIKTIDDLVKARWETVDSRYANDPKYNLTIEDSKEHIQKRFNEYIGEEKYEVQRAERDLEEQKQLLAKYEAQLDSKQEFDKDAKVEVIWQFLLNWKEDVTNYVLEGYEKLKTLRPNEDKAFDEYCEKHDIKDHKWHYRKGFLERYYYGIDPLSFKLYSKDIDNAKLDKILTEEIEYKYKRFIAQISDICGDIIDASGLNISGKGEINGFVVGTKGKCAIWTTLAYGDVQRPHYRVYIRKRD